MPGLPTNAASGGEDNIFYLGPFGRRVSFASQQRRALSLVKSLEVEGKLSNNPTVAVVGAGVGGAMVAAALKAKNCPVTVYETRERALSLQKDTALRYLHPTINFWPFDTVEATTKFPFFDWFSAPCNEVIQQMIPEWNEKLAPLLSKFRNGESVLSAKASSNRIAVTTDKTTDPDFYDLVIFATGFGVEDNLGDSMQSTYWANDKTLDEIRDEGGHRVFVSGTGDGGVIDFLRVIHSKYSAGRLSVEFLKEIDRPEIRRPAREIEDHVFTKLRSDDNDTISKFYRGAYDDLLSRISNRARDLLTASITHANQVTLVSRWDEPFEFGAAPVNKLMLAHALTMPGKNSRGEAIISFVKGEIRRTEGIYFGDGITATEPDFFELGDEEGNWTRIDNAKVVIRHGATPPIKEMLTDQAYTNLKNAQITIGDYVYETTFQDSEFCLEDYECREVRIAPSALCDKSNLPCGSGDSCRQLNAACAKIYVSNARFAEQRKPLATSYAQKYHGLNTNVGLIFPLGFDVAYYLSSHSIVENMRQAPGNLFGVKLFVESEPAAPVKIPTRRRNHV